MSSLVDHHPLARDFPHLADRLHELKVGDAHFRREMERYEALDKEIVRIEQGLEHRSDEELDGMKMRRVHLKDALHRRLEE